MFKKWIRNVFLLIGLGNLATMSLIAPFYDHTYLSSLNPEVFSTTGLIVIGLWGLAYISIGNAYDKVPYAVLVVAGEKLFYAGLWFPWISDHGCQLGQIFQNDVIAGLTYCAWGPYDFISGIFFLYVFVTVIRQSKT